MAPVAPAVAEHPAAGLTETLVGFGRALRDAGLPVGTGEVMMTGAVNVKVKDKLGRVESELSADSAKYKLDASAARP